MDVRKSLGVETRREIEVKVAIPDIRAFRRRLRALGARTGRRVHEFNVVFDTKDSRLRGRDELLRLRTNDGQGVVTFKGPSISSAGARRAVYKVRKEVEFRVSDAGAARELLAALGYRESFRYEKYRSQLRLSRAADAHVYLDETPIGAFLEIEGKPKAIDRAARRLGFRRSDYVTASYLALYAAHCRRHGRRLGDFVFSRGTRSGG